MKSKLSPVLLVIAFCVTASLASAATPAPPTPLVVTQRAGNTYFSGTTVGAAADSRLEMATGIAKLNTGDYILTMPVSGTSNELRVLNAAFTTVAAQATTGVAFNYPTSVMVAASTGKIHLIGNRHQIFELDAAYASTLLAGTAASGTANGVGAAASFNTPEGMAYVSTDSDILVVDTHNDCIRSIVLTGGVVGTVTTVAGVCGTPGALDSLTGTTARFNQPKYIAVAAATSYYYVFDNTGIRRVQPSNNSAVDTIITRTGNNYFSAPRPLPLMFDTAGSPQALYILASSGMYKVTDANDESIIAIQWLSMDIPLVSPSAVLPTVSANTVTAIGFNAVITIDLAATTGTYAPEPPRLATNSTTAYFNAHVVAGQGYAGNAIGSGDVSQFRGLQGLTQMPDYSLIACDTDNGVLRRLTSASWANPSTGTTVTTLTVSTGPTITMPKSVLAISASQIYVIDTHQILDYNPTTTTTVLMAGSTSSGFVNDATGSIARFNNPMGIVKSLTSVLVADSQNFCLRSVADAATYTTATIAGACGTRGHLDGIGAAAHFQNPQSFGMADTSSAANLHMYVSDNDYIRRVKGATFIVTTVTSLSGYSAFSGAFFIDLQWNAVDSTLWVFNGVDVSKMYNFTSDGSEVEYPVLEYQQLNTVDLVRTAQRGTLIMSTQVTTDLLFTSGTQVIRVDLTTTTATLAPGVAPTLTPMNGSDTYLVYTNRAGTDFSDDTDGTGSAGTLVSATAFGQDPITPFNYHIFDSSKSSTGQTVVRTLTAAGVLTTTAFTTPDFITDVAFRSDGACYLLSSVNHRVNHYNAGTGAFTLVAGKGTAGSADGTAIAATFNGPSGFTLADATATSDLLVSDTENGCMRHIVVSSGVVTSPIGVCGTFGDLDATGTAARFKSPHAIALATAEGVYFVIDNQLLRKVTVSTFIVNTVARFGYDQRLSRGFEAVSMQGPLRWNAISSTLFIGGGGSTLLEMKNLTASGAGYVYTQSHPIALPPSLHSYAASNSVKSLLVKSNGLDVDVLFNTKAGSVNMDTLTAVLPTNPPL